MVSPPAEPILSDDGWWQWDGAAWVPAARPPATFAPEPRADLPQWAADATPATVTTVAPPAAYPPVGYGPPAYGGVPYGHGGTPYGADRPRDGLAIAALVCSLIPVFAVAQLLALIFAIIVLTRVGRTGKKGQVMAICAIAVSVVMFFISAAIAIPVFLNQRDKATDADVRISLRNTANAEETYFTEYQTYATVDQLLAAGATVPNGLEVQVTPDGAAGYCLAGGRAGGSRWLVYTSFDGGLQTAVYDSPQAALEACEQAATSQGGSSAT